MIRDLRLDKTPAVWLFDLSVVIGQIEVLPSKCSSCLSEFSAFSLHVEHGKLIIAYHKQKAAMTLTAGGCT